MKTHNRLVRFGLVGVLNTALHLGVVAMLVQLVGASQLVSNVVAYVVASTFSYVLNSIWSFQVDMHVRRFGRFQLVGLMGLAICALLGYIGDRVGWHYVVTVLLTAVFVPVMSFLVHRSYTFSR
jgi:putative flippase GtrA